MPIELTALLARLDSELVHAAAHQPDVTSTDVLVARRKFQRAFKLSQALRGVTYRTDRVDIRESTFPAADGEPIRVRGYHPRGVIGPAPVLVYFHGALLAGDLDTEHARCLRFAAEADCVVMSVEYRRPPEDPFPATVEDCYSAVAWVARTAGEWGGDPARIGVGGSSSGATLAAAVALMVRDRGGPRLAVQMLLYPALDDLQDTPSAKEFALSVEGKVADNRWLWRHYVGEGTPLTVDPYAVPARCQDFTAVAPAYILVAEIDPLRDEAVDYGVRLMRDGVPVELHVVPRVFHGFDAAVPTATISVRALAEQSATLRRAFACAPATG